MMLKISIMGIFEYILDISREVNFYEGSIGVSFKAFINFVVFCVLNVYGRGVG